jgi:sugar phosphate isomerase/epimerase
VKDMSLWGGMTEAGAGRLDFRAVFAAGELAGLRHYFVEHDHSGDPLASARASYRYLRDLRF